MNHINCSSYRGCTITTRWRELDSYCEGRFRRFSASFSVESATAVRGSWQQFPDAVFRHSTNAADNALSSARRSIDLKLAEA